MLRYAITQGALAGQDFAGRERALLASAERWAAQGVDFVQLREKDLDAGDLLYLTKAMAQVFRNTGGHTRLLVNARADVALAGGADGVHLTSHPDELTPQQVRQVFALRGARVPLVSISAHTLAQVTQARDAGADLILFGPVFEKRVHGEVVIEGSGLERLHEACAAADTLPVLALGGITADNTNACLKMGAAGVAGIRLFS